MVKRVWIYCAVTLMAIGLSLGAAAARVSDDSKQVTIKGEVVDEPCYLGKNGARGEAHRGCAVACAKRGNQLAIAEDGSNTIYSITGDYAANKNEKLVPFVAETVEVTGKVTEKDGKKWIEVTSIKKAELK